ncbi:MAG: hypothetical protein U9N40_07020 [Euryarchaeota archaeon]|nr:hypothetical protein [Euryarchaeota archaeon]
MKKTAIIIITIMLMVLIAPVVAAAGEGSELSVKSQYQTGSLHLQNQTGIHKQAQIHIHKLNQSQAKDQSQVLLQAGKPAVSSGHGTGQGSVSMITTVPLHVQNQARNVSELKCIVQEKQQNLLLHTGEPQYLHSRNTVALAVHTFLAADNRNLTGGIGPQISLIAQEFNNSVKITVPAEEMIQSRSGLTRFFFGGDSSAAAEIVMQVDQNREMIREMDLLINSTDCDYEVREILQGQVQNLRQEQDRLQILAEQESRDKGIFGGLFE